MTSEQLKASILQMAIRGKLVEQCPEDGTAEDLFKQIQKEREKYKIRELSVEDIGDELFDIPETWKWVHLQDIVKKTIKRGKSPKYAENSKVQVFAQKCNVKTGGINMELALFLDEASIEKYPTEEYMCDGDIVINSTGGGTMGRVGIFHDTDRKDDMAIVPDGHVTVIRACDSIDNKYLYYFIKDNQKYLETQGEGSTNQTELKPLTIASLVLPLPPLEEQRRIVAKIEDLLPYVDRYAEAYEKLEQFNAKFPEDMKKSILHYAIQGKLVEQRPEEGTAEELYQQIQEEKQKLIKEGKIKKEKPLAEITEDEIPFDIPESWKWCRIYDVIEIATNLVKSQDYLDYPHVAPDNIEKGSGKLLKYRTVKEDQVVSPNHMFYEGQIIYSKIRPLLRKVILAPFDGLCSADMYPLNTRLDSKYVLYFLLSECFNHQVAEVCSSRVKMPKINQNELGKIVVPVPPMNEQIRIVSKIEELLPYCDRLKE